MGLTKKKELFKPPLLQASVERVKINFSTFWVSPYPQGEVVGEYAILSFIVNYRQPHFSYY